MQSTGSLGLLEPQNEPYRGWRNFLPEFRRKKKLVMQHVVECQPLRAAGGEECPEQSEMLLPAKPRPPINRIVLASVFLCFCLSGACVMWLTDVYDNSILKLVSIRNDIDLVFNLWRFPPTRPILSVFIFNYTNVNETLNGNEKPNVQEIGPYVFRERMERINIKFHENNTVSFQENRSVIFDRESSYGPLDDIIYVPNIPLITIINKAKSLYYLGQSLLHTIMSTNEVEPFQNITVHDFIWGYEDKFFQLIRNLSAIVFGNAPAKFGYLAKRRGIHHHVLTMKTGFPDLDTVGEVVKINDRMSIGAWGNSDCDRLDGSDGSLFPGRLAFRHFPLYIFSPDMCRRFPIYFNKTTESADGLPVLQYNVPQTLFDFSGKIKENMCYKFGETYPPSGTFFTGPCQKGAPTYVSFPHFWMGSEQLHEEISGLNPEEEKHSSYFQIHERLGICLLARTRFQLNIRLQQATHIPLFSNFENGTIFPVAWSDYNSGPLPHHFVNVLYHLTYTVRIVQQILQWVSLILLCFSISFMYIQVRNYYQ